MLEFVDTCKNVFEREDSHLPNVEEDIKEEISEEEKENDENTGYSFSEDIFFKLHIF